MFQTAQEIQSFTYYDPSEACLFRCPLNETCKTLRNLPFKSSFHHAFSADPRLWTLKRVGGQQKAVEKEKQGDSWELRVDDFDHQVESDYTHSSEAAGEEAQGAPCF